jgi:flagellar protein FliO/FliZ
VPSVLGPASLFSTFATLAIILGLLMGTAYVARRLRGGWGSRTAGAAAINVIATRPIGPQASLMIIEAEGQRFLISAGRAGVTAIGALGAGDARGAQPFGAMLDAAENTAPADGAAP